MARSSAEIVYISSPLVALGDGVTEKLPWKVNLHVLHSGDNRPGYTRTNIGIMVKTKNPKVCFECFLAIRNVPLQI